MLACKAFAVGPHKRSVAGIAILPDTLRLIRPTKLQAPTIVSSTIGGRLYVGVHGFAVGPHKRSVAGIAKLCSSAYQLAKKVLP